MCISHTGIYGCRPFLPAAGEGAAFLRLCIGAPHANLGFSLTGTYVFPPCVFLSSITLLQVRIRPAGWKLRQLGGQTLFLWESMGDYFHLIYLGSQ